MWPETMSSFLMPLAGLVLPFFVVGSQSEKSGMFTSACAHAVSPAKEPVTVLAALLDEPPCGRSNPTPAGERSGNVMFEPFSDAPLAFQLTTAVKGVEDDVVRPLQVPGVVPVLVTVL